MPTHSTGTALHDVQGFVFLKGLQTLHLACMISRNHLDNWLKSGSYEEGLSILRSAVELGFSCPNFQLISSARTSFTEGKLKLAIELLLKETPTEQEPEKVTYGSPNSKELPEDLQLVYQDIKSRYRKKDQLHGQLRSIFYKVDGTHKLRPNSQIGLRLAESIMDLHDANRRDWQRIDYFIEHKQYLPGTEPNNLTIDRLVYLLIEQPKAIAYLAQKKNENSKSQLATHYKSVIKEIKKVTHVS